MVPRGIRAAREGEEMLGKEGQRTYPSLKADGKGVI
jgi:hypothetical protein